MLASSHSERSHSEDDERLDGTEWGWFLESHGLEVTPVTLTAATAHTGPFQLASWVQSKMAVQALSLEWLAAQEA